MPEPPVRQIGFVTRDLEGALKNWLQIGVGPWFVLRDQVQTGRYRGNETTTTLSLALANSGDLQFEVIQPEDDTPSVFTEFLQAGREGLQQVAFWPEDYDATWPGRAPRAGRWCGRAMTGKAPASPISNLPRARSWRSWNKRPAPWVWPSSWPTQHGTGTEASRSAASAPRLSCREGPSAQAALHSGTIDPIRRSCQHETPMGQEFLSIAAPAVRSRPGALHLVPWTTT